MCITVHGSKNVQGVCSLLNGTVCCETGCIEPLNYSSCSNKALFPQTYVSNVNICAGDVQFCLTHALCQSAV